jgi:1,4-alpha-glucan branching enzyme
MLKKTYSDTSQACQVTFELPAEVTAQTACLCGEFDGWDPSAHPMERQADGSFALTLALEPGRAYRFRYLLDGTRWENDWAADGYVPNPFGSDDSLIQV